MTAILDIIRDFRTAQGEVFRIEGTQDGPYAAVDPRRMRIEAAAGASGRIVVVHTAPDMSSLEVVAAEDARLEITEVFLAEAFAEVAVKQSARSLCRLTAVQLTSANVSYTIDLDGRDAENMLGGVFLAGGEEHCVVKLRTNHNVPDCRSNSYIKGVAGGSARGEFCGLVYVAPDAQHTDAQQQNRNILLSEIVHQENLDVTEEEVEEELKKMAEQYKMELDKIKEMVDVEAVKSDLKGRKAVKLIVDNAKPVEKEKKTAKKAAKKEDAAEAPAEEAKTEE